MVDIKLAQEDAKKIAEQIENSVLMIVKEFEAKHPDLTINLHLDNGTFTTGRKDYSCKAYPVIK